MVKIESPINNCMHDYYTTVIGDNLNPQSDHYAHTSIFHLKYDSTVKKH